jgi:NADP-dependent 3-hydroxy acid dehydrogenase YdfG
VLDRIARLQNFFQRNSRRRGYRETVPQPVSPRLVVVTGASSGIGRATAQRLAAAGDSLVLMARSEPRLGDVLQECKEAGATVVEAVPVDVLDAGAVQAAMDGVLERHGRIDAVVHAAGLAGYGRIEEMPTEVFDAVLRTNVLGSVNVARSVLPLMRERDAGVIVLVGSVIGHIAVPRMTPYVVSKWAVRSLARQLQLDNRDRRGVHVCLVEPGPVDTPIYVQSATYQGHTGRPPPPVLKPERVARAITGVIDRPRKRVDVGSANWALKAGFTLAPGLYDVLVGPLYKLGATDPHLTGPTPGNALAPNEDKERLRGGQMGLGRALLVRLTRPATRTFV